MLHHIDCQFINMEKVSPVFYRKTEPFIPTHDSRVVGSQMVAGVLNIMGWHLVMIDREHLTSVQIDGENENDLLELKRLLEKTTMKISIQVKLNLPDS